jgi:hypothetical protein
LYDPKYDVEVVSLTEMPEEPLVGKPAIYVQDALITVASTDASAPAPIEPRTYRIITQSGKPGKVVANIYDAEDNFVTALVMESKENVYHGITYDFSKLAGKQYIQFDFIDAVTNKKTQVPDKYWISVGTVGPGPWISTDQPEKATIKEIILLLNDVTVASVSSDAANPTTIMKDVKYDLTAYTTKPVSEIYFDIYDEQGSSVFPNIKLWKENSMEFTDFLYVGDPAKLGKYKLTFRVLRDEAGSDTFQSDYWVNVVTAGSECRESGGICGSDCSVIAQPVSGFVCTGGRACCISPYIFRAGKQIPASCITDYAGACAEECLSNEELMPWDLGCAENAVCCVVTGIGNRCPGICASDCSVVYESIGQKDCEARLNLLF